MIRKHGKKFGPTEWSIWRKKRHDRLVITSTDEEAAPDRELWIRQQHRNRSPSFILDEEWLAERAKYALIVLRDCVELNPGKCGGIPVLRGTRFTIAQLFAEIGEGRSLLEIAADFGIDAEIMKKLMEGFSIHFDRPLAT